LVKAQYQPSSKSNDNLRCLPVVQLVDDILDDRGQIRAVSPKQHPREGGKTVGRMGRIYDESGAEARNAEDKL
jgi:hypothetical protein